MVGEVFFGADQDFQEVSSPADSAECQGQALNGTVGTESILRLHSRNDPTQLWCHPMILAFQNFVDVLDEFRE